jgi:polysaccharide export outer membrane protein
VGCTTVSTEEFNALQRLSLAMAQARKDYRIQPGDTVRVVVYKGAELPSEYQQQITVQPDGTITLVNGPKPVKAEGLTVEDLQKAVKEAYSPVFQGVAYEVTVQFLTSQKAMWLPDQVYVAGEVYKSNAFPYRKGLTALQAIAQAGGWKYTADEERVVILRCDAEGQTVSREVDLASAVAHLANDVELQPGDVVFVPLSTIARLDIFVEMYIRALIPINPSVIRTFATGI